MVEAQIELLGRFRVRVNGSDVPDDAWTRRSASRLVKLLALAPGHSLHRDQVLEALWPELSADSAQPRLHTAAHYARHAVGRRSAVVLRGNLVQLLPGVDVGVDVDRFRELAQAALAGREAAVIDTALAACPGVLLPGDLFEPWTEPERQLLGQLDVDLLRAAHRWHDLLLLEPADEQAHLALMQELAEHGDRRGALRQFERLERALRAELGVAPSPEAAALRNRLAPPLPVPSAPTALPRLVGRRQSLRQLDRLLDEARVGRGGTALVGGPAGVGVSAVLRWTRARAVTVGARVGAGTTSPAEGSWPYAPVLEAVADLCRRHPSLLADLDALYREEIRAALRGARPIWSGEEAHPRLFLSVAELLRHAAAGTGVVLTVDDLQDADDGSLRLLHHLARVARGERIALVLGHHEVSADGGLRRVRDSLLRRHSGLDVTLSPLAPAGTAALLAEHLGAPADDQLTRDVHALSRGLPLHALELLPRLDSAAGLRSAVASLLSGCPDGAEEVLRRMAVAGSAADTDEFVALAATDEGTAYAVLDATLEADLLETSGVGYRFRSSRLRHALLADVPQHRVQRLHRDVAAALGALGAAPARIGHHLLRAGDARAAAPHLLRAAEGAATLGAYRDALDLVDQARDSVSDADRSRTLALRADVLHAMGDPGAITAYRQAVEVAPADQRRLLLARLARAANRDGDHDTAAEVLAGLEPDGGPADSAILLARGTAAYFEGDLAAAEAAADEARRRLGGASDWRLLDLMTLQGLIAHHRGEWFQRLRYELHRTRESPELATAVFDGHLCVAEYLLYGPTPYAQVIELGRKLRETAQRAGVARAVAFASALTGEAALLSGDLAGAERDLEDAVRLHAGIAAAAGEAHSLQRLAEVRLHQGDREEARRLLRRALPLARWSPLALHLVQRIHGTTIAAADTPEDAYLAAERGEATVSGADYCSFCAVMVELPSSIACADVGEVDGARRHLAAAQCSTALWRGTSWQAGVLEAEAHLAHAENDGARCAALLAEAADGFQGYGQPLDAARCRASLTAAAQRPGRTVALLQ